MSITDETPGSDPTGLQLRDVSMRFAEGTEAFRNVTLSVQQGEFVSIVGPSGCGKSTILRIVAGLLTPTAGHVTVKRDSIGFVFQDPNLMPWRSVRRNAELFLELRGSSKNDRATVVGHALDLVGLHDFADRLPHQLSGGMRMRVSLARSLALNPEVFLFDEPFGALDEITRQRLNEEVAGLFDREGFAGLFITHSITEAVFMSTRVMVMSPRPGTLVDSFDIPFPYPRTADIRFTPDFTDLCASISKRLEQLGAASNLDDVQTSQQRNSA